MPRKPTFTRIPFWIDLPLLLVTAGQILLAPIAAIRQLSRFLHPSLHQEFVTESWKAPSLDHRPPNGLHVVIVGPTIGEFRMMAMLANELRRTNPEIQVTYCLRDHTSIAEIRKRLPDASLQYRPVEFLPITVRWMRSLRPNIVIFVEGMRFPIFAWTAHLFGAKNILVNGRCSRRDKWHHNLRSPYFRWLFSPFDTLLYQTEDHRRHAARWVGKATRLLAVGDLKASLSATPEPCSTDPEIAAWLTASRSLPILAAGSTEDREEDALVIDAYLKVNRTFPCRLLLAPRLPSRADDCFIDLQKRNIRVSRRTDPHPDPQVLLLDTLGELQAAYAHTAAAYVGGFFRGSGHNLFEPVSAGIQVTYGPHRGAFESMQLQCEAYGIGAPIRSSDELASAWIRVLAEPDTGEAIRASCEALLHHQSGPLTKTVAEIGQILETMAS